MLESNYNTLLSIKPCWELSRLIESSSCSTLFPRAYSYPPAGLCFERQTKMKLTINDLIRDRQALVEDLNFLRDCEHDAHVEAVERCSATGIGQQPQSYAAEITAAREKLAAFDSAHPEVKQEIERRRQERIKRHVWD